MLRYAFLGALAAGAVLALPSGASAAAPNCVDTGPTEQTCRYRVPITVKAYEVLQQSEGLTGPNRAPQFAGHVTKMETDIVDASGAPVPISRLMLHHIVFINAARQDNTCASVVNWNSEQGGFLRERFFAAGEERAKIAMPQGYGYKTNPQNFWGMYYMVMNHRAQTDSAFIEYTVTVDTAPAIKDVTPYWLDINDCHTDPYYNVPGTGKPGSLHTRTKDLVMPRAGAIVAGIGHVHGGAQKLTLTKPNCNNQVLTQSLPTWGNSDHPFYNVRPILHEPGPTHMTAFRTPTGLPVQAGETIRLNSIYDNSRAHTRVMGIEQIYVDHSAPVTQNCAPLPGDVETLGPTLGGRPVSPEFTVPLTGLDSAGNAVTLKAPPGALRKVKGGTVIGVGDRFFAQPNVKVKVKKGLVWRFDGNELHNITLANGPVGIASDNLDSSRTFWAKFPEKGTYNFFCSLHPVQMHERVVVSKKKKKGKKKKGKKKR
jgi:plastocyanin